jgi:flagellar protein FlgJ
MDNKSMFAATANSHVQSAMDFQGLGNLKAQAARTANAADNPALRKAAEQFEAHFIHQMIKTMREASASNEDGDLMGSNVTKTYEAMFDQEVAQEMAKKGGIGLSKMMVESFARQHQPTNPSTAELLESRAALNNESAKRGIPLVPPIKPLALGEEERKGIALPRDFKSLPLGKHR